MNCEYSVSTTHLGGKFIPGIFKRHNKYKACLKRKKKAEEIKMKSHM